MLYNNTKILSGTCLCCSFQVRKCYFDLSFLRYIFFFFESAKNLLKHLYPSTRRTQGEENITSMPHKKSHSIAKQKAKNHKTKQSKRQASANTKRKNLTNTNNTRTKENHQREKDTTQKLNKTNQANGKNPQNCSKLPNPLPK